MKDSKLFNGFWIFLIFISSCGPVNKIQFESLEPASYSFPVKSDSTLILNLAYYPWVDTIQMDNIMQNLEIKEAKILDTMILKSIFDGLFSVLDESANTTLRNNKYLEIRSNSKEQFLEPIGLESVNQLCEEMNTSLILSLEYYGFNFDTRRYFQDFDYYMETSVKRELVWRIYVKDSGLVKEFKDEETLYWNSSLGKDQNELITWIRDAFWFGGEKFGRYISPSWKNQERYAYIIIEDGEDISESIDDLKKLAATETGMKSFKAWYNLAICYEKTGEIEKAVEALNKALKIKPGNFSAMQYNYSLKAQYNNRQKLDKQLINNSD